MSTQGKLKLRVSVAVPFAVAVTVALAGPPLEAQGAEQRTVLAALDLQYKLRPLKPPRAPGQPVAYLPGEPIIIECSLRNVGRETAEVLWMAWADVEAQGEDGKLPNRNPRLAQAEWEMAGVDLGDVRRIAPGGSLRKLVDLTRWQVFPAEGTFSVTGTYVAPPPKYALRDPRVTVPKLFLRAEPVEIRMAPPQPDSPSWEDTYRALERAKNLAVGVAPDLEAGYYAEGTTRAIALVEEQVLDSDSYLAEWGYYYRPIFMAEGLRYTYRDVATLPDAVAAFKDFLDRYPKSVCAEVAEGALMALQENIEPVPAGLPFEQYRL